MENLGLTPLLVVFGGFFMPFIPIICRSSHLFKIIALFDKVISLCPIFDLSKTNQYEKSI